MLGNTFKKKLARRLNKSWVFIPLLTSPQITSFLQIWSCAELHLSSDTLLYRQTFAPGLGCTSEMRLELSADESFPMGEHLTTLRLIHNGPPLLAVSLSVASGSDKTRLELGWAGDLLKQKKIQCKIFRSQELERDVRIKPLRIKML